MQLFAFPEPFPVTLRRPRETAVERVNCLVPFTLCPREANAGNLQPLYEFVREALKPVDRGEAAWRCPVLLVDDLSVLLGLGVGAVAVLDFIHYCRATVCCALQVLMRRRPGPPAWDRCGPGRPRPHWRAVVSAFACVGFALYSAGP